MVEVGVVLEVVLHEQKIFEQKIFFLLYFAQDQSWAHWDTHWDRQNRALLGTARGRGRRHMCRHRSASGIC